VLVEKVKQCACGSVMTAIERIEGREGDVFYFKNRAGNPVRVFSDMIARCMIYASGFHEFRVIQTDYEHLDVFVDQINTITKTTINREFKRLAKILQVQPPTIIFKLYERDLSRKLRRIERSFLHEQN
jgi:phenylacetate-coenzyme A ligase PaaK-like adenylate-forming protein